MLLSTGRFFGGGGGGTPTDPFLANVLLLCGFEGTDASTSFVDESPSPRTLTANGDAQIDTAQFKFGASSLLCDGTGDFVSAPDSADWNFSGQFTIEAFVRFNTFSSTVQQVVSHMGANGNISWALRISNNSTTGLTFLGSSAGSTSNLGVTGSATGMTTGVWYHLCVDRDASNVLRIYLDGVMKGSATVSGTYFNSTATMNIGRSGNASVPEPLNGWVDELRITGGIARYGLDAGFAVPAAAYPRI